MAFTDVKGSSPRTVLQGSGLDHVLLAENVDVGDLIGVNLTNQWVLAKASATVNSWARYFAAEEGVIGDTIGVFALGVLEAAFAATSSEFGDPIYLADTAGQYTSAVGTHTQNVGWINDVTHILVQCRKPAWVV